MVRNVHSREFDVPVAEAGALLDTLGGPDDVLWPSPWWPAMHLDQPLRSGSAGGHGPIRYRVGRYEPGRLLECGVDPGVGLDGTHTFTVEAVGADRCRIRHEIDGRTTGTMRLGWPLAVRWLHDAVLEDLLDRADAALGTGPARPATWSPWVRVLRRITGRSPVEAVPVPDDGLLDARGADAADAFAVRIGPGLPDDPRWWARALFRDLPPVVVGLLALREALVGLVGIERARGDEFDPRTSTDDEVLIAADAGHLDFRCVVRTAPRRVVLATAVDLHGFRGRLYWGVVRHVHPWVVRAMLARAARRARDQVTPPARPAAVSSP
ncbi:DUF2867 domain-containing protein [Pseudonocardia endophytica]|uniref:Uncharacterized protein DUF2867 n=1 Tax=Pseudonocardia endophytica TaxID=401976 RepID=A0A4V2PJ30_PSEEN|nr:DUF2867 domain-containing protein [Pseudonocardia endophytica]TCK26906.1 uncharacterized protein DUF2867 [Pseudonocardia endophytica]